MLNKVVEILSDHNIEFSENTNSDTADVKFIICDFNPNGNNVSLNRDTIDNWLDTLKFKPVVGKVVTRFDGKRDFSGHNVKIVDDIDENGDTVKTVEFDTSAFGSFYDVSIEEIDEKEYIVASAKLWKRYKEAYKIIKDRVNSKKGVKTSWEISVSDYHQETIDGKDVKVVNDAVFLSHCVLGEFVNPAYKESKILEVANKVNFVDEELSNALLSDILSSNLDEEIDNNIEEIHIESSNNEGSNEELSKNKKVVEDTQDVSALTDNDVYTKVRRAINNLNEDKHYYVSILYPYEFTAIAYTWERETEEDFVKFQYTVNSDDTISITSQTDVKMTFVEKETLDNQLSELNEKVKEYEADIAEAGKSITTLTKEKEDLETQISELNKYKKQVEEMEKAENERILSEKKEELKSLALEDELIESSELEEDETLKQIFSELTLENFETSQEKIEVIKGRRAIEKFKQSKQVEESELETSESKESKANPKRNLNDSDEMLVSAFDAVKNYLSKK